MVLAAGRQAVPAGLVDAAQAFQFLGEDRESLVSRLVGDLAIAAGDGPLRLQRFLGLRAVPTSSNSIEEVRLHG